MKNIYRSAIVVLTIGRLLTATSHALTPFSEKFDSEELKTKRWKIEADRSVSLSQKDGRLHFTAASHRDWAHAEALLRNNQPGYNENWEVIVDVSNTNPIGDPSVGVNVFNADDPSDKVYLEFCGKGMRMGGIRLGGGFQAYFNENGQYPDGSEVITNPEVSAGSLRVSFDKTSKALTLWFDKTGSANGYQWIKLATYSTNGSGGKRPGDWNMNRGSGRFGIMLRGSAASSVEFGKMSFDNFVLRARKG